MAIQKILIVNLHSARNLGDDAIMAATLAGLAQRYPAAQVTAAANDPESWHHHTIATAPSLATWLGDPQQGEWRRRLPLAPVYGALLIVAALCHRLFGLGLLFGDGPKRRLLQSYYAADLVLSCGGGNFYAHRRVSPALIYGLGAIAFPALLGKRVIMLPQSVGPIDGGLQRKLASMVFSRVDTIMVRDPASQDFVTTTLGVRTPVHLQPDLAFGLARASTDPVPTPTAGTTSRHLHVGVTVLDRGLQTAQFQNQPAYEDALVEFACALAASRPCRFHFLVQCTGPSRDQDDRAVTWRVAHRCQGRGLDVEVMDAIPSSGALLHHLRAMDWVLGTRMHTAILALGQGAPTVLVGYQPKSCSMMTSFGLGANCHTIDGLTSAWLAQRADALLADLPAARRTVAQRLEPVAHASRRWLEHLPHG